MLAIVAHAARRTVQAPSPSTEMPLPLSSDFPAITSQGLF